MGERKLMLQWWTDFLDTNRLVAVQQIYLDLSNDKVMKYVNSSPPPSYRYNILIFNDIFTVCKKSILNMSHIRIGCYRL